MLTLTDLVGFGSKEQKVLSVNYVGRVVDEVDRTTYTFSGTSLGAAGEGRAIIFCITGSVTTFRTITAFTLDGVDLTEILSHTPSDQNFAPTFYGIFNDDATTGDISVTFSGSGTLVCQIGIWNVYGIERLTPYDTLAATVADPATGTIDVVKDGVIIAAARETSTGDIVWTGITQDYDVTQLDGAASDTRHSGASLEITTTEVGRTITADGSSGIRMGVISYAPQ